MRVNVFHIETDEFCRIKSQKMLPHGYLEVESFDPENCFHLCNWFHWAKEKPENVHSDIDTCGHGVMFYDSQTKEYWLALSTGWCHGDLKKISGYLECNWEKYIWLKED